MTLAPLRTLLCAGFITIATSVELVADSALADPLRLDPRVRPVSESLELTLNPAREEYSGVAQVELQFDVSTNGFRFHAQEIGLIKATLDKKELALTLGEAGLVCAQSKTPLAPGLHTLEITFTNDFNRDATGLYKAVNNGKSYLFTDMEPKNARRAFPCWDEPAFKIPWRLTVTIPKELEAVSNMPIAQMQEVGSQKMVEFGRTPPLPSYLVALAVGPLEFLPVSGQPIPGRIVTAAGKTNMAAAAAQEAPRLLAGLEHYFGFPCPYPKLDHVAVPEFNWGGMENAGAIFYMDAALLRDKADQGFFARLGLADLLAHEMAHLWFGDLVTMRWWDDLWLNESFASWMSFKVVDQVHPELRIPMQAFQVMASARHADAERSVKPIRRQFGGGDNVEEAFDTLSYSKGQAILTMVEGWIGEEHFRSALQRYFERHRWGNTRAEDLWDAFGEGTNGSIQEVLRRYIEQPGIPELTFRRLPSNRCQVRQQRYRNLTAQSIADQVWHVPVTIRYGGRTGSQTARFLLKEEQAVFEAPGLDQADWIYPNAGETGHYLWSLPPELTSALSQKALPQLMPRERQGLLGAANFAALSGHAGAEQVLELALALASDPEPEIRAQAASQLASYRRYLSIGQRPQFAALMRQTLGPILHQIGYEPRPGELPALESLRTSLLLYLGQWGEDPEVLEFSRRMAARQLADPRSVPEPTAALTLSIASWHGDASWFEKIRQAFEKASDPDVRSRFLGCLTTQRDPALLRTSLEYQLTDAVKPSECSISAPEEQADVAFEWLTQHYDAVKAKLPPQRAPSLVWVLDGASPELLAKGRSFFLDPARRDPLTELNLTKVTDAVELRNAMRQRNGEGLARFIEAQLANRLPPGSENEDE